MGEAFTTQRLTTADFLYKFCWSGLKGGDGKSIGGADEGELGIHALWVIHIGDRGRKIVAPQFSGGTCVFSASIKCGISD